MLSVYIVTIEGYFYTDLTTIKSITIANLRGGAFTYNFAAHDNPKQHHWPSIHFIERNLHQISYWEPGLEQNKIADILYEFCHNSLVIVPNTHTALQLEKYLRKDQIVDLQNHPRWPAFSFPKIMDSLCGRHDASHNARHCTITKSNPI